MPPCQLAQSTAALGGRQREVVPRLFLHCAELAYAGAAAEAAGVAFAARVPLPPDLAKPSPMALALPIPPHKMTI